MIYFVRKKAFQLYVYSFSEMRAIAIVHCTSDAQMYPVSNIKTWITTQAASWMVPTSVALYKSSNICGIPSRQRRTGDLSDDADPGLHRWVCSVSLFLALSFSWQACCPSWLDEAELCYKIQQDATHFKDIVNIENNAVIYRSGLHLSPVAYETCLCYHLLWAMLSNL